MGKPKARYCIRANPPKGWQVWDRKLNRWWGNPTNDFPSQILERLNSGEKGIVYPQKKK